MYGYDRVAILRRNLMPANANRREDRLDLRMTQHAKSLLKRAADLKHKTVSAFLLETGLAAAAEALADRREFQLDAAKWKAFTAALDAPFKPKPRLQKLLGSRSAIE
jgi:uncharacterized protein (DUF1778 family)